MNSEAIARVTEAGLEALAKLAGISGDKWAAAQHAVKAIVEAIRGARARTVSPQVALTQIETLQDGIFENDSAALDELQDRFRR